MRCPYCRIELKEPTPRCPNCKLTLNKVNVLLGAMPRLSVGMDDALQLMKRSELKKLSSNISRLNYRFPQVNHHLIVRELPTAYPFEVYLFWFFNSAGLSEATHRGGENRDILLLIDPAQKRAGIAFGYGLQEYLSQDALDHVLQLAEPAMRESRWLEAFAFIYDRIEQLLEAAANEIKRRKIDHSTKLESKWQVDF